MCGVSQVSHLTSKSLMTNSPTDSRRVTALAQRWQPACLSSAAYELSALCCLIVMNYCGDIWTLWTVSCVRT